MSTNGKGGYTFKPSLKDISLKRFRLRYCAINDCYYLHWDSAVCPQLSRIEGLMNGVYAASGVERRQDEREAYICCEDGVEVGRVQWKIDFSDCGLVVSHVEAKVKWVDFGEEVEESAQFTLVGDDSIMCAPYLGERAVEIPEMVGCHSITLMTSLHQPTDTAPVQLLRGETDKPGDCPLDIIIDLMCPHREYLSFVGELLLGLKYTPEEEEEGTSLDNDKHNGDIPVIREGRGGELHVHVVEGAGIFDEETRKPFNAVVKCDLLPDTGRYSSKQTSPRHNAYPTWVKEFVFSGLSRQDLVQGGMEVLVCDHHHFLSDSNIGGLRLCVPQRSDSYKSDSASPDASPASSRSNSPTPAINGDHDFPINGEEYSSNHLSLSNSSPRIGSRPTSKTLPSTYSHSPTTLSPIQLRRVPSPSPRLSPSTLSPVVYRRSKSPSPKSSPMMAAKNFFRLSGSHLRELSSLSSPRNSPLPTRKKNRKIRSRCSSMESEFIFWWMEDVTSGEVKHWQQMLNCEGQWVYFWHALQPKLKPAYS